MSALGQKPNMCSAQAYVCLCKISGQLMGDEPAHRLSGNTAIGEGASGGEAEQILFR
jgi:hypothetical protein